MWNAHKCLVPLSSKLGKQPKQKDPSKKLALDASLCVGEKDTNQSLKAWTPRERAKTPAYKLLLYHHIDNDWKVNCFLISVIFLGKQCWRVNLMLGPLKHLTAMRSLLADRMIISAGEVVENWDSLLAGPGNQGKSAARRSCGRGMPEWLPEILLPVVFQA